MASLQSPQESFNDTANMSYEQQSANNASSVNFPVNTEDEDIESSSDEDDDIDGTYDEVKECLAELKVQVASNKNLIEKQAIIIETLVPCYDQYISDLKENHENQMEMLRIQNPALTQSIKELEVELKKIETDYRNARKNQQKEIAKLQAEIREARREEKEECEAKMDAEIHRLTDAMIQKLEIDDREGIDFLFNDDMMESHNKEDKEKERLKTKINELDNAISQLLSSF